MDESLSIGTDTVGETDVLSVSATDADENVVVDVKHLSADPENVAQFREQLHSKPQSKATESTSTTEGATKRDASENPVSKHSAPNERNLFGNNGRNTPPFVAGKAHTCPSQSQNTDGSRKDFREKSMKFDISSQSAAPKTAGGAVTRSSEISVGTSVSTSVPTSEAVVKKTSWETPSAEKDTVSTNASVIKPTETKQQNVPETSKPLSKTAHTASASEPLSETQTRERPHSSDNTSDTHRTAVIDTIPFLRTSNENVAPVSDPTAAQASKSHATLLAQQIRDHIIDRILVSSSALNDSRTVTVQLSPRLLQDTEVQFTQNGTSLDIRLVSQNKDSVQFLQQHQSDLQTYLQGELKAYRAISVRVPPSQASAELSQPHDGRSRNRFEYQATDEEGTT